MRSIIAAVTLLASTAAFAADLETVEPVEIPAAVEVRDIVLDLGAGVSLAPKWPSSKIYQPGAFPLFRLRFLRLPVVGEVVTERERIFSIYPSFEYTAERNSSDASYLRGIPDRDFSFDLGPGASLKMGPLRAYAQARYGFFGHNGFVGEVGVDFIARPFDRLEVSLGPQLGWADSEYMDYYFGVPASAVELEAYNPGGGIKDIGLRAETTYEITETWRLHGRAEWTHFVGDAQDSPIVQAGNENEFRVGVGFTYRFGLDLY